MAVPAAVQKQADEAQKRFEAAQGKTGVEENVTAAPAEEVVEETATEPEIQATTDPGEDTWAHKYRVLQSKFDAEVPRLHEDLRAERRAREQVQTALTELVTRQQAAPQAAETQAPELSQLMTDFPEIAKGVQAMIAQALRDQAPVDNGVHEELEHIKRDREADKRAAYTRDLTSMVSNWEVINNDPRFLNWLSQIDPFTGVPIHNILTNAYNKFDAQRTATIFTAWIAESGAQQVPKPKPKLDHKVEPVGKRGNAEPASTAKIYTRAEIKQYYDDVQRGRYRGKEEEMQRIDRDIVAANHEGRIRP